MQSSNLCDLRTLWKKQVTESADKCAISYDNKKLTFKELDEISNIIAYYIKQKTEEIFVGVMMDETEKYVAVILGVLKAEKAFVPIDNDYPLSRVNKIIENCGLNMIIRDSIIDNDGIYTSYDFILEQAKTKENKYKWINTGRIAYILHSSGTTGEPKGIIINTKSLINLVKWFGKTYINSDIKRIIQLARISFDVSIEEIFGALLNGCTLYIPNKKVKYNKRRLRKYIKDNGINLVEVVPATLKEFFDDTEKIDCLNTIICGGDSLGNELKNSIIKKGYKLYNNYGPTEATVDAMYYCCSLNENVQLGSVVDGCGYFLIDEHGEIITDGGIGELCLYGIGLAEGYVNDYALTNEKFIIYKGIRIYKTGDLVRMDENNKLLFVGRMDNQIKLRGQRIELGEIEEVFSREFGVKICRAIYIAKPNHERIVMLYENNIELEINYIINCLKQSLPSFMIPANFYRVSLFILNDNGKIDEKEMTNWIYEKEHSLILEQSDSGLLREEDELKNVITDMICEVLEIKNEKLDLGKTYSEIGFDSLSFIKFTVMLEEHFELEFDLDFLIPNETKKIQEIVNDIKSFIVGNKNECC